MQRAHHLVRAEMELEQTCQKTCYNYRAYGTTYSAGKQVLVFPATVRKGETKKLTSFYKGPYIIVKIINDLNFCVCQDGTKKFFKVLYKRLKKYETRENFFRPINNVSRAQQQEMTSWVGKKDDNFIKIEVKAVFPGHAKHNAAADETNIEEYTHQNKQN